MTEADKITDISTEREDLKQNEKLGLDKKIKAEADKECKIFNSLIIKGILVKMTMLSLTN